MPLVSTSEGRNGAPLVGAGKRERRCSSYSCCANPDARTFFFSVSKVCTPPINNKLAYNLAQQRARQRQGRLQTSPPTPTPPLYSFVAVDDVVWWWVGGRFWRFPKS